MHTFTARGLRHDCGIVVLCLFVSFFSFLFASSGNVVLVPKNRDLRVYVGDWRAMPAKLSFSMTVSTFSTRQQLALARVCLSVRALTLRAAL